MPSATRRTFVAGLSTALVVAAAGCAGSGSDSAPAHWVSVYLGEREETHDVTVAVTDASGATLFEEAYRLSDDNEAEEDEPIPGSSEPESVVVTVDGVRFERDWPGVERPGLPCGDPNRSGVELWIESASDGTPALRLETGCQRVANE
ncbi:hypothetical protein EXE42_03150 [Halorubrum sp. SP3]|uniref:hypothetical protein n=1 Tax=unclassified Halorubrum TaxID=2642239 RepID=UPI0010F7AC15|nr:MULTISPECIES: hypothetical protein [unclassified Halorubrum]TKX55480.1 hypothetical protein EXE42_03150 [Halorubrum sp. SP3]TKX66535.1 hypothetical protein EXE45_15245 [Halorubrum sp. SP9]